MAPMGSRQIDAAIPFDEDYALAVVARLRLDALGIGVLAGVTERRVVIGADPRERILVVTVRGRLLRAVATIRAAPAAT